MSAHKLNRISRFNTNALVRGAMFVSILLLATNLQAQNPNNEAAAQGQAAQQAQTNPNKKNPEDLNDLNITDAQKLQMRAIRDQLQIDLQTLQRQQRQANNALNQAIYSGTATDAEIEARSRTLADAHQVIVRRRALAEAQVVRVLTPEQLEKFRELRRKAAIVNRRARQQQQGQKPNGANKLPPNPNGANTTPGNNRGNLPRQKILRPNRARPRFFAP